MPAECIRKAINCASFSFQLLGASMSAESAGLYGVDPKSG